jgi:hypothetical protein
MPGRVLKPLSGSVHQWLGTSCNNSFQGQGEGGHFVAKGKSCLRWRGAGMKLEYYKVTAS